MSPFWLIGIGAAGVLAYFAARGPDVSALLGPLATRANTRSSGKATLKRGALYRIILHWTGVDLSNEATARQIASDLAAQGARDIDVLPEQDIVAYTWTPPADSAVEFGKRVHPDGGKLHTVVRSDALEW